MTPFDRRWQHLVAAARRAPATPLPDDIDRLLARAVSPREDFILPSRLGWAAAACLFACALSLPWMADVLAALQPAPPTGAPSARFLREGVGARSAAARWEDLAPSAPTLPALPKPPRLPLAPTLPDVRALVQSLTSEETVR